MSSVMVKIGQIWRDRDSRMSGRLCKVTNIVGDKAIMHRIAPNGDLHNIPPTKVSLTRLQRQTGWQLKPEET